MLAGSLLSIGDHADQDAASAFLQRVYTHFLGRHPDDTALAIFQARRQSLWQRWRIVIAIATSVEARATSGWLLRLLGWPMQHAQFQPALFPSAASAVTAWQPQARPAPYGGLSAAEPDSAEHGVWVGPRLDLPVCAMTAGRIGIKGFVDLGLLARGRMFGGFRLDVHGPAGLLHSASIEQSGQFSIDITVPVNSFANGSQWTLRASAHVVPKAIGLGEDTRELAWRVISVRVDDITLIDSARSPTTLAIEHLMPAGGINLVGYLAAELGLGEASRSLARACVAAEVPFSAVDVGFQSQNLQRDTALLKHAVSDRFPIDLMYVNADQTAATANYLKAKNLQSRYRIGYWHWEQPQIPATALGAFAHVDEVWVPSTFVYDAVAPYSPVPVIKIPHALEFAPSPGLRRSQFNLPDDKLLVLVMYDFHSYQYRKNPQAALAAFRRAAAGRTDVALVIKTINGQHHAEAQRELRRSVSDLANIIFIDEFFTRQQVWDLQASCDILLSLHRGEGFGLAPAEMMYLGKAVIATGWSANMDFMSQTSVPWMSYQSGTQWRQMWFEDSLSLLLKTNFAKKKSLAGVGIWALSYEAGRPELWNGIKAVIAGTVSADGNPSMPGTGGSEIISIIPNPVRDKALVSYNIVKPGRITLSLYDTGGRQVAVIAEGIALPGIQSCSIDAEKLAPGIYFCVMITPEGRYVKKFAVAGKR